jgi:hypothetical protein
VQLVFIYGPPAAGKHAIAKPLAEQTGIALFHNHLVVDIANGIFQFGSDEFNALRERLWLDTFEIAANANTSLIFTFNPEASVRPALLDEVFSLFTRNNGDILQIELTCSDATIEARLTNTSRQQFTKLRDVGMFRQLRESGGFEFSYPFKPRISINTDEHTIEESVRLITRHLSQ